MQQNSVIVLMRHGKVVGLNDNPEAVQRWLAKCEEDDAYAGNFSSSCSAEPWTIGHTYEEIENASGLHSAELEAAQMQERLSRMSPQARAIMDARERP